MRNNSIVLRDPFREFDNLVRFAFGPSAGLDEQVGFRPVAESHRDGDDAVIRIELPGLDAGKDVHVELNDHRLVVSGERRDERSEDSEGRHLREIRYGSFTRTFRVAPHVTAEDVVADYDAGVLTLRVNGAYAEPAGSRIEVGTGHSA